MNGTIKNLTICGCECSLYLPPEYFMQGMYYPVVYMNGQDNISEIISDIESHFGEECEAFILLSIQSENWNDDYTPWSAPALTKKSEPFGGGASKYLYFLENSIKPFMDAHYRTKPEPNNTALIGHSLGGLTSLYALYISKTFGRIGSLSGSLWYDGWIEFMGVNKPLNADSIVYLSLGKGEEHSRNQRMATVGNHTRKAAEILTRQLALIENVTLEWKDGGHFTEIPERFQRALIWLMQFDKKHI
jgi:predicted alpha/beta superfamily hydrolase